MEAPFRIKRPADLKQFVLSSAAQKAYLIFSQKSGTAYCTRCGKMEKIDYSLLHNEETFCPFCGMKVTAKDRRYGRKGITQYGRVLWFAKNHSVTFAQLDEYNIDYTGEKAEVSFWPSAQYRFSKKSQEYYKHIPEAFWMPETWEKRKNVKLPEATTGMWNSYCVPTYQHTVTHHSYISCRGTDLRYANMDMLRLGFRETDDPYALIGYIYNFLKYPSIEILEKSGFEQIVGERANGRTCRRINWRSADLRKILKLNRKEIREFREAGGELYKLEKYKFYREEGLEIEFSDLDILRCGGEKALKLIESYIPKNKAIRYLRTQEEDVTVADYADYLKDCKRLGLDMDDKRVLKPKNFQKAHTETAMQMKIELDAIKKREFKEAVSELYGFKEYRNAGFLIRPAESAEELHLESQVLHHCVRTYVDKVRRKDCVILFIRKVEEPDVPYFTLELNPKGQIIQCRGDFNCGYPKEVGKFIESWKKDVLKKKKGAAATAA